MVNDVDINGSLETSYQIIFSRIQKWLGEGSGWLIELSDSNYINISVYNPLARSSYVSLPEELRNPERRLIFKIKITNYFAVVILDS